MEMSDKNHRLNYIRSDEEKVPNIHLVLFPGRKRLYEQNTWRVYAKPLLTRTN